MRAEEIAERAFWEGMTMHGDVGVSFARGLRAYHEALREAGALAEWAPIETAPKDKPVLLWGPYASHPVAAQWSQDDWVCVTDGGWAIESQGDTWTEHATMSVPTHWMPLPRPPTPEQGGER